MLLYNIFYTFIQKYELLWLLPIWDLRLLNIFQNSHNGQSQLWCESEVRGADRSFQVAVLTVITPVAKTNVGDEGWGTLHSLGDGSQDLRARVRVYVWACVGVWVCMCVHVYACVWVHAPTHVFWEVHPLGRGCVLQGWLDETVQCDPSS